MPAHSHPSIFRYFLYLQDSAGDVPDIQSVLIRLFVGKRPGQLAWTP